MFFIGVGKEESEPGIWYQCYNRSVARRHFCSTMHNVHDSWDESEDSERTGLAECICLGPFWLAYRFGKFDGDG